jgi:hypothetical protein
VIFYLAVSVFFIIDPRGGPISAATWYRQQTPWSDRAAGE